MLRLPVEQFEAVVEEALTEIPEDLLGYLDNVVITVEDEPSREDLEDVGLAPGDALFGLYQGVPLPEREVSNYAGLPDRIVIYRLPLLRECSTRRELLREIRDTVIHEVGHFFGFEEHELP